MFRNFRKEQLFRYRRYIAIHLRHATLRKLLNLARVEWRLHTNNPDMKGLAPYLLFVDVSSGCNLRCPLCTMGQRNLIKRKNAMDLPHYRQLVEPIRDYLFEVFLYNWSEPFLNKHIFEIIRWNKVQNIASVISSNLSLPVDADKIVDSGLEYLIVSADGITQDVYERYRVGGKLDLVVENVRKIVEAKQRAGSKYPYIEWQSLITKKNEEQAAQIPPFAYGLGVDAVRLANLNFYSTEQTPDVEEEWLPTQGDFRAFELARQPDYSDDNRKPCYWLWRTSVVNPNGGVVPCCLFDTPDWDNALERPFLDIWNDDQYRKARSLGTGRPADPSVQTSCDNCKASFLFK